MFAPSRSLSLSTLTALVLVAGGGVAAAQDTPLGEVYACAEITDDTERLACYDASVGRVKAAETSGEFTAVTKGEIEQVQRDAFGFSMPSLPRLSLPRFGGGGDDRPNEKVSEDGQIEELTLGVQSISKDPYGKLLVRLANGQVWQQIDTSNVYYSRKNPPETATIKRAAMGSFRMKLDKGSAFRVKRVE